MQELRCAHLIARVCWKMCMRVCVCVCVCEWSKRGVTDQVWADFGFNDECLENDEASNRRESIGYLRISCANTHKLEWDRMKLVRASTNQSFLLPNSLEHVQNSRPEPHVTWHTSLVVSHIITFTFRAGYQEQRLLGALFSPFYMLRSLLTRLHYDVC